MKTLPIFSLSAAIIAAAPAHAAINYSTFGSTYTENFNTLASTGTPTWTNDSTISGWYAAIRTPTPTVNITSYVINDGNQAAAGSLQSLGGSLVTIPNGISVNGTEDRALGSQNPNSITSAFSYGVKLINNTGSPINAFNLQYAGEIWRAISNEAADGITFDFQIFNPTIGALDAATRGHPYLP